VVATVTVITTICRLRSAPTQESQVKMYKPVFLGDLRAATKVIMGGQRVTFLYMYSEGEFFLITNGSGSY
jgi:hypothetical protein